MILNKNKKSQAEVITTVLLILISIAAVVLVSVFIINMVRTNLVSTDCFKTAGQFKINLDEGYTYYNTTGSVSPVVNKAVYISISRGEEAINLSGLMISIGSGQTAISYTVGSSSSTPSGVTLWNGNSPVLPGKSETRTYRINSSDPISKVKIVPIIEPDRVCKEGSDEQTIPSKT